MRKTTRFLLIPLTILACVQPLFAEISESTRKAGEEAVAKGIKWLQGQQKPEGYWSSDEWPALTGFSVWAMSLSDEYRDSESVDKAIAFLKSNVQPNGGIYVKPRLIFRGGGKSNYNTAISMVALHLSGREDVRPIVLRARNFVASGQKLDGDLNHGGFGYDVESKRGKADLSNTYTSLEALAITEDAEDLRTEGEKATIDKKATEDFLRKIQNLPENSDTSVSGAEGGFGYYPTKPGKENDERVTLRSFGSMTYAGLLALIYADVDRSDPRVKSALDWAANNWSLEENPGMEQQGLYFFYNVMSKALAVYGDDELEKADGTTIPWREDVIKKLVSLQQTDEEGNGYWVNKDNRFWEGNPVLVTGYTLIALQVALQE
jgi:squalene-hopene/tetraprenyl-beta-curcumene cyclase